VIQRSPRQHIVIWALVALASGLFLYADGRVEWVFLGAAVAILEEGYWGIGPKVNLRRPRHWLVFCALVSPLLPFAMLGTAHLNRFAGFALGLLVTVVGWRLCIRPALEATRLSWSVAAIPLGAAAIVVIAELGSTTPLASSLLLAAVVLWALAVIALLVAISPRVTPMPAARIGLGAGACALLALVLAAHGLTYVDGELSARMAAIRARTDQDKRDELIARVFAPRLFLADKTAEFPRNPLVDMLISKRIENPKRGPVLSDGCFVYGTSCGKLPGSPAYPYGTYASGGNTLHPYGVIYVRVAHKDDPAFKSVRYAPKSIRSQVTELVQYWLYYGYDRFEAVTPFGRLVQQHESDWEAVSVGLADSRPLFVAYNAHCGGEWLKWGDVPAAYHASEEGRQLVDDGDRAIAESGEATHPAVMVALGSQASYPASAAVRVPDWTSCIAKSTFGNAIAVAASIKEHVEVTEEVVPVEVPLTRGDSEPINFPGHWGLNNHSFCVELVFGIKPGCAGGARYGPEGPPAKKDWTEPFKVIFHSHTWREGESPSS
jgi:hypothetical protein